MTTQQGHCLCGAVKFSAELDSHEVGVCHCSICRRWSCGPTMMVHTSTAPIIENPDAMGRYRSSDYGERCFCKTCGSTLMWWSDALSVYTISADAFEAIEGLEMHMQIYIDSKPDYYDYANNTVKLTGAEFEKMMSETACS